MLKAQRRQRILERLKTEGQVSVTQLSREWEVSEDTVRRDLRDLAGEGLVQRVHGGALPASPALGSYQTRQTLSGEVKAILARTAVGLIRPGQVVAVDGGTSNLELVRAFPPELACTVVTHSPLIAAALAERPRVEVLLIGGRLFRHSMVCVGAEVVLLVSPEKWGAASAYQIVPAAELSVLVVEASVPEESLAPYRALGLDVLRAQG